MLRILSKQADKWFRNIIAENRKSRENVTMAKEDFLQILLNVGKKLSNLMDK